MMLTTDYLVVGAGASGLAFADTLVGENAGYDERATGAEVRTYFADAAARLVATGPVRILGVELVRDPRRRRGCRLAAARRRTPHQIPIGGRA